MLKSWPKNLIVLSAFILLCTCIDPYKPKLNGYQSLLVVDGLITNENSSYSVKLSRTFQELDSSSTNIPDATVFISDDLGNSIQLLNNKNGIYKTDSTEFKGTIGRTYTLHILTIDGDEFESEPCQMLAVPDIDSIYIAKGQQLVNNGSELQEGVSIYLDSKTGDNNQYYRWTYDETWEFKVQNPKKYDYIKVSNPNTPIFNPVTDVKEFCWKNRESDEIIIREIYPGEDPQVRREPIYFIATDKSDRLLIQYSILVKQYSISKNEYEFWNNLKQVNETGGDIFAKQPYAVISNIHSKKNADERVLGFFQVSAVSEKRKNITYRDVALMGLPFYSYTCQTWEYAPSDFETLCRCPPKTWDDVYWYLSVASDYIFIQPKYSGFGDSILLELEFARPECADCELSGSHTQPDFWIDLK